MHAYHDNGEGNAYGAQNTRPQSAIRKVGATRLSRRRTPRHRKPARDAYLTRFGMTLYRPRSATLPSRGSTIWSRGSILDPRMPQQLGRGT